MSSLILLIQNIISLLQFTRNNLHNVWTHSTHFLSVGCTSPMAHIGLGSLPVILGSPTKFGGRLMSSPSPDDMGTEPVHAAFGQSRPRTVPENMATIPFSSEGLSLCCLIWWL